MNFVFWNTNRKDILVILPQLVAETNANVVVLAECNGDSIALLRCLQAQNRDFSHIETPGCDRITVLTDAPSSHFSPVETNSHVATLRYSEPNSVPFLMCCVHLQSKLHCLPVEQLIAAQTLKTMIDAVEARTRVADTLVVGDFNMNPFEDGMVAATAMHSLPSFRTAKRLKRRIGKKEYSMFYNPCWSLLGDANSIPGTYFYNHSSHVNVFWHVFDQVVLRPTLVSRFDRLSLRVVSKVGSFSLMKKSGNPKPSDHFPLAFSINTELER